MLCRAIDSLRDLAGAVGIGAEFGHCVEVFKFKLCRTLGSNAKKALVELGLHER